MNTIEHIKNNGYLKKLYPEGLSNIILNSISFTKDLNTEIELLTSTPPIEEIDLPYSWKEPRPKYYFLIKLSLSNANINYKNNSNSLTDRLKLTELLENTKGIIHIEQREYKKIISIKESGKATEIECDSIIFLGILAVTREILEHKT